MSVTTTMPKAQTRTATTSQEKMNEQQEQQQKRAQTTKKSVSFSPTVTAKLIPHHTKYSKKQQTSIWYTQVELELMKETFYIQQEQLQNQKQRRKSKRSNGSSTRHVAGSKRKSRGGSPTQQIRKTFLKLFPRQ